MASKKKSGKIDPGVADRVREIKEMQANWMKQRQIHQDTGGPDPEPSRGRQQTNKQKTSSSTPSKAKTTKKEPDAAVWIISGGPKKSKSKSIRTRSASPVGRATTSSSSSSTGSSRTTSRVNRTPTYAKPPTPKTNSAGSVTNQKKRTDHKTERDRKGIYGSEPDLSNLNSAHSRSIHSKGDTNGTYGKGDAHRTRTGSFDKGATYDIERIHHSEPSQTGYDTTDLVNDVREDFISDGKKLMDPDMFNKLADQIANRVKAEIEQEQYHRPRMSMHSEDSDTISSHKCSKCKQLMIPPDHTPTLIIPCGHTFCEACAEDRIKCPTCRTKVSSTACNTTLQAIIQDFLGKKTQGQHSNSSQDHRQRKEYSPTNYADKQDNCYKLHNQRSVNSEEQGRRYAEEYQSLMIRAEALQSEKQDIQEKSQETIHKLDRQKKQVNNIEREEQKLIDQIAELQERLETLQTHKSDYQDKLKEMEDAQEEDRNRLSMIDDTLKTIYNSMEKAKMLAGNFNVHIGDY